MSSKSWKVLSFKQIYKELVRKGDAESEATKMLHLYLACCFFFMGMYKEADEAAQKGNIAVETTTLTRCSTSYPTSSEVTISHCPQKW